MPNGMRLKTAGSPAGNQAGLQLPGTRVGWCNDPKRGAQSGTRFRRRRSHAAREVITKTMHVLDRGAMYGVPSELLDDCCLLQ